MHTPFSKTEEFGRYHSSLPGRIDEDNGCFFSSSFYTWHTTNFDTADEGCLSLLNVAMYSNDIY